ncbi:MAG TPA: tetratricopeptide repeat protein [Vicinamibacterales bacterium]|nr:tetratricopeptide repeat protein [Vicinamibacterales bacterium]
MASGRRLFVLLYAASGAAALVYEVTWTRLLTLQLGHTVAAASTVLAAFMGGLALGAWLSPLDSLARDHSLDSPDAQHAGQGNGRPGSPLRLYAVLEIVVAICALLLPIALRASVPALAWAYADGGAPARFAVVRVAISLALLGIPAAAMGATFPIAAGWYARNAAQTGALYAVNTAGAALGAIGAGFFLIPALGLRATTWVGVLLNLMAAGGAWWLAAQEEEIIAFSRNKKSKSGSAPSLRSQRSPRSLPNSPRFLPIPTPAPMLACSAAAISGFAALVYEVAWTRLLALVIGPTTYAFATMAAAFISGLALGSALGSSLARRVERPAVWMAAMLVASAIAASGAAWLAASRMPLVVAAQVADPAAAFTAVIVAQAFGTALLLLPMTLALGATFPLALAVAQGSLRVSDASAGQGGTATIGRDAARVYTANTVGAIAGALAAGFALIPALGLRRTFQTAAILGALAGASCLAAALRGPRGRNSELRTQNPEAKTQKLVWPAAVAIASLAIILLLPGWDRELLASGAYKYAPYLGAENVDRVLRAGVLEYYKEGAAATVSVRRLTGTRSLAIDGKVDASNAGDMLTQRMLGLLPVLIHGNARDICIIGLGSGVTLGSALAPGIVQRAEIVEISPEVVEASHFFDRENGGALANPRVRLIVGDGRSHLLLTPKQYDVIVSEPSNPWMAGVASLFTREFFEAARARLKPDGLICQWAHTYDISPRDLQSIVRTFASVFPQGTLWMVGGGDLLLIGARDGPILPRLAMVETSSRSGATALSLTDVGVAAGTASFAMLSQFAGGPREMERYGDGALIQTDDRTALEYSAPRGIYGRGREDNVSAIRGLTPDQPPAVRDAFQHATEAGWTSRGVMDLKAQAFAQAFAAFRQAVTLNSRNVAALSGLSDAAGGAATLDEERKWLHDIATREPANADVRIELSRVLAVTGDVPGALDIASEALQLAPEDPRAAEQLASVLADAGDGERLAPLAEAMVARFPDRPEARYYRATALYLRGKPRDAVAEARQVVSARPDHARAQSLLGAACVAAGMRECALEAFGAAIQSNPREPSAYVNAGLLSLQSGNPSAAADFFASALTIDPSSKAARDGLAQARPPKF